MKQALCQRAVVRVHCTRILAFAARARTRRSRFGRSAVFVIKPTEEPDPEVEDSGVVDEDELPEYIPDPLLNATVPEEDEDITQMDPTRRTTKIIVDLVNAGSLFEDKLEEYSEYLNADLLEKFYRRIEMAEQHEDESASEGLRMIWRRVRAEVERLNASPSLRLLDKLLALLHPTSGGTSQDRCRNALGLMYEAFTQSQSDTVDIFDLAESLSDGTPPPSGLLQEFVLKDAFIQELKEILDGAEVSDLELRERRTSLMQQKMEADIHGKEFKILSKQLASLEQFLEDRRQSLRDVQMLLDMAKAV